MTKAKHMRLRQEFLSSFDWNSHRLLQKSAFCDWSRKKGYHLSEHNWKPLQEGNAVPVNTVAAFSEFITAELKLGFYPVSQIAEPAQPPEGTNTSRDWRDSIWQQGWQRLADYIGRNRWNPPDEAFCRKDADIALATEITFEGVGFHFDRKLSPHEAKEYGKGVMQRSFDEHASFLLRCCQADERTVMFPTVRDEKGDLCRFAVSVVVPITADAYRCFTAGKMEDCDLQASHIVAPSRFLFIVAVNERVCDMRRSKKKKEAAQMNTGLFQLGSLFPPLWGTKVTPALLTFAGTPVNKKRIEGFGFRPLGVTTRLSKMELFEQTRPGRKTSLTMRPRAYAMYYSMMASLLMCQDYLQRSRDGRLDTDSTHLRRKV